MHKPTLALKATVTRRPTADPVDQAERQRQDAHHQAVIAGASTSTEPAPAQDPEKPPKRDLQALQSAFLTGNLRKTITVFVVNGIRLVDKLHQYDQFTLLIEGQDGISSLVFKHAATTIVPVSTKGHPPDPARMAGS